MLETAGSSADTSQNSGIFALWFLLLLLIIPIGIFIYIKRRPILSKYNSIRRSSCEVSATDPENREENLTLLTVTPKIVHSKVIKIAELENYIKESLQNGELERQHALFPKGQTRPWEYGALPVNKTKNRYTNLVAYDHSRVILSKINGNQYSDYINANYIDGYKVKKAYIATQGPKMVTVVDFWRMIWQENVKHIAMLANIYEGGKKKVEKYWPDQNETLPFGDITVYYISSQVYADFEHRVFKMFCMNETRTLNQYHFSSWPDHGVPLYSQSLVPFLETLQKIPLSSKSPIVVHCSAGVGRTGTILLCDIILRMAAAKNSVDLLKTIGKLRDQRPNMVDNVQQYKLAHLVVLEYLFGLKTGISCNEIEKEVDLLIANGEVLKQMRYLEDTQWQDQVMKSVVSNQKRYPIIEEKNRFQNITPEIQGSIFLSRYPVEDESSTYINAVRVDGFKCPDRFIVTQQPLRNTVGDFWRLIDEKEISVVISLNAINVRNKTSCSFWPTEKKPTLKPVDYMTLKHVSTLPLSCYTTTSIQMYNNDDKDYRTIEILSLNDWPANTNCPKKIEDFLTFWEKCDASSRQSNPVLVTCFDGALASGLYVAMSFVIEKMKLEQVCDVCQAVRTVRHNRSQFVMNEEQFTFLYKAAVTYISGFQSYANFN